MHPTFSAFGRMNKFLLLSLNENVGVIRELKEKGLGQ
jgi:hypothetical protein